MIDSLAEGGRSKKTLDLETIVHRIAQWRDRTDRARVEAAGRITRQELEKQVAEMRLEPWEIEPFPWIDPDSLQRLDRLPGNGQ